MADGLYPSLGPLKRWLLTGYRDSAGRMSLPIAGHGPNMMFLPEGRVTGSGGCNRYMSSMESSGTQVRFGIVANTLMYCEDPSGLMAQEADFLACLSRCARAELEGERLDFYDDQGVLVLSFTLDKEYP